MGGVRHLPRLRLRPRLALTCLAVATLSGCLSLEPRYTQPQAPIPASFPVVAPADTDSASQDLAWRTYFTDPLLQTLIQSALDNNRDLRKATLRVEEARAAFRIQRSDRVPTATLGVQGARSRVPGDLNASGASIVAGEYRGEVGLNSWELDLWGRVHSLETSALETWLATDAARQAVQVALVSQVAEGYLGLRELDERVLIARKSVSAREASYRIFQRRYELGATSKLEVMQVKTLLTQSQTLHAQLAQQRAQQVNALQLLIGGNPGILPDEAPFDDNAILAPLAPGLPSDLLVQRPDIIAAEHRLRASHANIGAARAAFFPRIALTGSYGSASAELDGLFDSGSRAWAFMPTISLPIFDGGRRRAGLALSEVRRDIAVADYEQSVQIAFRDVADALAARHWTTEQSDIARTARDAQAERARLAQLRYDNGSSAYLEVLDAQRDLLEAEQHLISTRRAQLSSQIALYSALGGGTEPADHAMTGPDAADTRPIP
ncbi:RND transporter [Pseudoxanthomonas jiangsuensis]|nr:RND transporter [Pseudoxanthomonas jiangsuensis]